ncbi:hypothetical protein ACN9MZ_19500 [Pseudoduganella sp. S-14]|jgi:hypothetical protein|uniref:hypothetical protein n=1 Tax=Pseudoduganella sp. S-14 TaxID=3404065 RepID=UPI003CF8AFEC
MRTLISVVFASLMLAPAAHADDLHHPLQAAKPSHGAAASDQRFAAAYEQMKKMVAQMEQIRATRDPKERERLMQQHLDSMHEGVRAMRPAGGGMMQMMGCQMMRGQDKASAQSCPMTGGGHVKPAQAERMDMMEKRMDMMQMMMEQMVEREGMKPMPKQE